MIGWVIGLFIGFWLGVLIASIFQAHRIADYEERLNRIRKYIQDEKEQLGE